MRGNEQDEEDPIGCGTMFFFYLLFLILLLMWFRLS